MCVCPWMCVWKAAQDQNKSVRLHSPGVPRSREQHQVYSLNSLILKITAQPTWRQPTTSMRHSSSLYRDAITCTISTDAGSGELWKVKSGLECRSMLDVGTIISSSSSCFSSSLVSVMLLPICCLHIFVFVAVAGVWNEQWNSGLLADSVEL